MNWIQMQIWSGFAFYQAQKTTQQDVALCIDKS
jgi:hypothetical protein